MLKADFYKIGIIVDSLEDGVAAYREVFDYDWRVVPGEPFPVRIGEDTRIVTVRAAVTVEQPRLHLIERIPGTPWEMARGAAAHHIAYWVDDFPTAAREIEALGFGMELGEATDAGQRTYGYFSKGGALRIEILERPMPDEDWGAFIESLPAFPAP